MHSTDKYSQYGSIIWAVWLSGWVFVYELSGYGLESRCYHLMQNNENNYEGAEREERNEERKKTKKIIFNNKKKFG